MKRVHLDTDIGGDIDDLCALAMLLRMRDVEITGITTVADDAGKRAGYAKRILKLAGREDIPLKAGADVSGGYYRYRPEYPNDVDYWGERIPSLPNPPDEALELLKESIEHGATIIGIGQYTNFALLEKKYPGSLRKADLYLMGGYLHPIRPGLPQLGNDMDYNIQLDIASAQYVLENAHLTLVPIAMGLETALRRSALASLAQAGALGGLIVRQAEAFATENKHEETYGKTCVHVPADAINFQYDPLACAIAVGWREGVMIEELPLTFEIRDDLLHETIGKGGKPTNVVRTVDGERFNEFWHATLLRQ